MESVDVVVVTTWGQIKKTTKGFKMPHINNQMPEGCTFG